MVAILIVISDILEENSMARSKNTGASATAERPAEATSNPPTVSRLMSAEEVRGIVDLFREGKTATQVKQEYPRGHDTINKLSRVWRGRLPATELGRHTVTKLGEDYMTLLSRRRKARAAKGTGKAQGTNGRGPLLATDRARIAEAAERMAASATDLRVKAEELRMIAEGRPEAAGLIMRLVVREYSIQTADANV